MLCVVVNVQSYMNIVPSLQSGGDMENDEGMADQLMKLTKLSLKVLESSNSSAKFRRLSGENSRFMRYIVQESN